MARADIDTEVHKKVKVYAALKGLTVREAYSQLLEKVLKKEKKGSVFGT